MTQRPFGGRRVLLGVTGGIASYKAAALARLLTQSGAAVDVVLSRAATAFVGAITFEALTGRAAYTSLIEEGHALDHIRLAKAADLVLVAPATADFLARAAQGRADDLLTACLLATRAPVLLAPAMNDAMWAHPQTGRNVHHLRELGYTVVDPDVGPLAAGEGSGPGRMPEPEALLEHAARALEPASALVGRQVLVTAGPTREPLDPVRYLSNGSSGKMGVAIAAAAWRRGADVTLIAGPLSVPAPRHVRRVDVETTAAMRDAVAAALPRAELLVMAAAPADFRPEQPAAGKLKKSVSAAPCLPLAAAPDILMETIAVRRPGAVTVGFALETDDGLASARRKLQDKMLDLIILNPAGEPGAGIGTDTNRVTLLERDGGMHDLPTQSKTLVADAILDWAERRLAGGG